MAIWLKKGISAEEDAAQVKKVRETVEQILDVIFKWLHDHRSVLEKYFMTR